jgi:hypothetical protein
MEDIMKFKVFIIGILIILVQGCAGIPNYVVDIDSINSPDAGIKNRYILLPGEEGINSENLQFKEYAAYVERALSDKGFVKADDINNANIAIYLSYGIGDPQEHLYTYSFPVWGETGGVYSYDYVKVQDNADGTSTYSTIRTYTPIYGIVDYDIQTGSTITYQRYLILDALDLDASRSSEKYIQLWQTTVTSIGSNGDLRLVFPIMVGAAKEYIGNNTGKKVRVTLYENDKRVLDVKGIEKPN